MLRDASALSLSSDDISLYFFFSLRASFRRDYFFIAAIYLRLLSLRYVEARLLLYIFA